MFYSWVTRRETSPASHVKAFRVTIYLAQLSVLCGYAAVGVAAYGPLADGVAKFNLMVLSVVILAGVLMGVARVWFGRNRDLSGVPKDDLHRELTRLVARGGMHQKLVVGSLVFAVMCLFNPESTMVHLMPLVSIYAVVAMGFVAQWRILYMRIHEVLGTSLNHSAL